VSATHPVDPRPSLIVGTDGVSRCAWAGVDAVYQRYHDEEWGTRLRGDRALFEKLSLEGFQAGLSWITILRRRKRFREVFHDFEISRVAAMTSADVDALMTDTGIIRNRAKIESTIANAALTLELQRAENDPAALDRLLWSFAPPARAQPLRSLSEVPAVTPESTAMSKALRALGYRFVGPTTLYALMQSSGMVDDHVAGCVRSHAAGSPLQNAEAAGTVSPL
jgi:DNA-3-methyladenine glycosylase I